MLLVLSAVLLAACGAGAPRAGDEPSGPASVAALDFRLPTVDGGQLDGSTLAGRDVALWFWAPWCPTCNAEAPGVARVAASAPDGVEVIGVAARDEVPAMQAFVERHGLQGLRHVADTERRVWDAFGIPAQPAWVFVDDERGPVDRVLGPLGEEALAERLTALAG
jgi:thiol-disulfide isomerase/thioredoxin